MTARAHPPVTPEIRLSTALDLLSQLLLRGNQLDRVIHDALEDDSPDEERLQDVSDAITIFTEDLDNVSAEAIQYRLIDTNCRPLPVELPEEET